MDAAKSKRQHWHGTPEERLERARHVAALVRELGSQVLAAARLGLSRQSVNQILSRLPENERPPLGKRGRKKPPATEPIPNTDRKGRKSAPAPLVTAEKVEQHIHLVEKIARQMAHKRAGVTAEEFLADGYFGLLAALRGFNPARNVPFEIYAARRIRGAILDAWRDADELLRRDRRQLKQASAVLERLEVSWGRVPTFDELLEVCGDLDRRNVQRALEWRFYRELKSIDTPQQHDDGERRNESLAVDPKAARSDSQTMRALLLDRLFAGFTWEQRFLLWLYHMKDVTMKDIARVLRLSESRISQQHTHCLERLRLKFTAEELWPLLRK